MYSFGKTRAFVFIVSTAQSTCIKTYEKEGKDGRIGCNIKIKNICATSRLAELTGKGRLLLVATRPAIIPFTRHLPYE